MKLGFLSGFFPFARREQFFDPEVTCLVEYFDVTTYETRATKNVDRYPHVPGRHVFLGLVNRRVLALAFAEFRRAPSAVLLQLWYVATTRCALRAWAFNLGLFPKALAFAHLARRDRIEHIHVNWMTTSATLALVASRLTGIPFSITAHQHDIFSDNLITDKVREARFVRVISARNCRHLQERVPPELRAKCLVLHVGVALPETAAPPAPSGAPLRVLCAARLCAWKGHSFLIEALMLLRDRGVEVICDFAGADEMGGEVHRMVERSGLGSRVRMLGVVPHAELVRSLEAGAYDVSILASTETPGEHEGIPVAMMEAMAVGLPVVATRTGSLDELVDPDCGILVEQRNAAALATALETLAADPELRRRLGARGREKVLEGFEVGGVIRRLAALIQEKNPPEAVESQALGQKSLV